MIKTIFSCFLIFSACAWATDKRVPKNPTRKAAPAPAPVTPPAGAIEVDSNTYRYTDPQGRQWIYYRTPFGFARSEEKPGVNGSEKIKTAEEKIQEETTAVEEGDVIKFEQPSAFGRVRWQRKKEELNAKEQKIWDRVRGKKTTEDEKAKQQ